jgi:hypothetical protein
MSTATTPTTPVAPQLSGFDEFELVNRSSSTKVTYQITNNGPIIAGQPLDVPLLTYSGPEGQQTFSGSQIMLEDTPMGTLLSVALTPESGTNPTTFSLFLPPIVGAAGKPQNFATYAVKTHPVTSLVAVAGAQLTYEVEHFEGDTKLGGIHAL